MMDVNKEFLRRLTKIELEEAHIILNGDVTPKLHNFINFLSKIKFEDGSYHTYYGLIKTSTNGFLIFWNKIVDDVIKEADKNSKVMNKDDLLLAVEKTVDMLKIKQTYLDEIFLSHNTPINKKTYEELGQMFKEHMENIDRLKFRIKNFDKKEQIEDFNKEHFHIGLKKTREAFEFTHTFISLMLADHLYRIKTSLTEITQRLRNNMRKLTADCDQDLNELRDKLYDKNRELTLANRRHKRSSLDAGEIQHGIEKLRNKIKNFKGENSLKNLESELNFWEQRMKEFSQISNTLNQLKAAKEYVTKQIAKYESRRTTELPGAKHQCWLNIGENLKERKQYLDEQILAAAKTLFTFFSVRGGYTRMLHGPDNIGLHQRCEYGHKVYIFDLGLQFCHVDCEGLLKEFLGHEKYYFDVNGRYLLDKDGQKVYQNAPCTPMYTQDGATGMFQQISGDCGHSERPNKACKMEIRDSTDEVIWPQIEYVDIKDSLDGDTVKYLWDNLGSVLPYALRDVAELQPNNPIHYLAHRVLRHKYDRTYKEQNEKKKETEEYRIKILQERKDKAISLWRAWRAKQVPYRKPEEDVEMETAYDRTYKEQNEKKKETEEYRINILQERKDKAVAEWKSWREKNMAHRKPEGDDDIMWTAYGHHISDQMFTASLNYYH